MQLIDESAGDFATPAAKRRKVTEASTEPGDGGSRIFAPYRTIGLVSPTPVPFTSVPLGKTTFQITTSVGRNLQTYDLRRGLNLAFLSHQQTPGEITATCAYRERVFSAWHAHDGTCGIWVFKRGRVVGALQTPPPGLHKVNRILVFGSWIIGCCSSSIEIWRSEDLEHYTTLLPSGQGQNKSVLSGAISNLPTFLNKVFVGRLDGNIEVWNVSTGKLVHTILPPSPDCGLVLALEPAPSLSMLAISYVSGLIVIQNVQHDQPDIWLRQKHTAPVTSISFRSDGLGAGDDGRADGVMATASIESGDVTLWDLNEGGKISGVLRGAHEVNCEGQSAGISKIEFLRGQPVMVSSGQDNSLRSWIFDQSPFSPIPRPLHSRSGHGGPVTALSFLPAASDGSDEAGKWLISAASDRSLWGFSLRRDGQNSELSQGNVKRKAKKMGLTNDPKSSLEDLKATEVTNIVACLNRDGGMGSAMKVPIWSNTKGKKGEESSTNGWESVVTTHRGEKYARTWLWGKKKAGRWTFETGDSTEATSVAISPCGTFALVGSNGGCIDMFNLQSGIHRQRFPPRLKPAQAKRLKTQKTQDEHQDPISTAHSKTITGIAVDSLNRFVISTSLDGSVRFWDFLTGNLLSQVHPSVSAITALRYNPISDLISISSDDLSIRVIDTETRKVVRELWGCSGQIYDHCFSNDGRWIIACSMDSVVRIWDLPTGHLIDAFRPESTVTSLAVSSTGEYLATAHAGSLGICMWNNKGLYRQISTTQICDEDVDNIANPTIAGENVLPITAAASDQSAALDLQDPQPSMSQLSSDLLTLSLVPKSRWQTLLHLDTIRQRNKPIEPPKQPQKAPFFLSAALSAPDPTDQASTLDPTEQSRIAKLQSLERSTSAFTSLISAFSQTLDPSPAISHLISLSPSATDLEIRTLAQDELAPFVRLMTAQLRVGRDYELVNTWMSVFLRLHGEAVSGSEELGTALKEWRVALEETGEKVGQMVGYVRGVLEFLRSGR